MLAQNVSDDLSTHDDYVIFLLRQSVHNKVSAEVISGLISKLLASKTPKNNKDLLLTISEILVQQSSIPKALEILKSLFESHSQDKQIQGRYLSLLVDSGNLSEATRIQARLPTSIPTDDDDLLQRLIEEAMPEKRKEQKTRDVVQQTKGGAEIFMPSRKRKRQVRYPKGFDPKNPGQEPDLERWLPKWQRSRFKKIAKKKGIYLKGAQGDA